LNRRDLENDIQEASLHLIKDPPPDWADGMEKYIEPKLAGRLYAE
jgi:hypothetical protein